MEEETRDRGGDKTAGVLLGTGPMLLFMALGKVISMESRWQIPAGKGLLHDLQ